MWPGSECLAWLGKAAARVITSRGLTRFAPRQPLLGCVGCRDPVLALIWYALLRGGGGGGEGRGLCRLRRRKLPRRKCRPGRSIVGDLRRRRPDAQASARVPSSPIIRVSALDRRNVHQEMYLQICAPRHRKRYTRQGEIHQPPGTRLTSMAWHGARALTSLGQCLFVSYMQYVRA